MPVIFERPRCTDVRILCVSSGGVTKKFTTTFEALKKAMSICVSEVERRIDLLVCGFVRKLFGSYAADVVRFIAAFTLQSMVYWFGNDGNMYDVQLRMMLQHCEECIYPQYHIVRLVDCIVLFASFS